MENYQDFFDKYEKYDMLLNRNPDSENAPFYRYKINKYGKLLDNYKSQTGGNQFGKGCGCAVGCNCNKIVSSKMGEQHGSAKMSEQRGSARMNNHGSAKMSEQHGSAKMSEQRGSARMSNHSSARMSEQHGSARMSNHSSARMSEQHGSARMSEHINSSKMNQESSCGCGGTNNDLGTTITQMFGGSHSLNNLESDRFELYELDDEIDQESEFDSKEGISFSDSLKAKAEKAKVAAKEKIEAEKVAAKAKIEEEKAKAIAATKAEAEKLKAATKEEAEKLKAEVAEKAREEIDKKLSPSQQGGNLIDSWDELPAYKQILTELNRLGNC
jgi:hypothetical protein